MVDIPRLVIAAPASGHGKTTVATGLMAALRERGSAVSGHKVGPDYIDPGFHELATGSPPRNLDPFLQGEDRVAPLLAHGAREAEVAVIEGVMGLFDGALATEGYASTAHLARLVDAPIVLVVDAGAASRSVAALVHGFATFDPRLRIAGVILNKLGSQRHEDEIRSAVTATGVPVLGALRRDEGIHAPDRHLGLVPAAERAQQAEVTIPRLAAWIESGVDLEAVARVARSAPELSTHVWTPHEEVQPVDALAGGARPVVAAGAGRAFTFRYTETTELLRAAGVDVVDVDPMSDRELPPGCAGLYLGGGFPEVYSEELAGNERMRSALSRAIRQGCPVVAECAGMLYLARELDGVEMTGVLAARARMTRRGALGYRNAEAPTDNLLARQGERVTGHEFHRTELDPSSGGVPAWRLDSGPDGFASATLHASYLHVHWAGHPWLAQRFAEAARSYTAVQCGT